MKQSWQPLHRSWLYVVLVLGIAAAIYLLYFRLLYGLTGGLYSTSELASQVQSNSLRTILHNPLNAPYELLVWFGLKLGHHSLLVTRIASVLYAIPLIGLFYWVARHWFPHRIAMLGTILFATSSSFLHFARFGSAQLLQMAPLVLLAGIFAYRHIPPRYKRLAAYGIVAVASSMLYIPGMVWFAIIGLALLWRRFRATLTSFGPLHAGLIIALPILLLGPLFYMCVKDPVIIRGLLGLPDSLPSITGFGKELLHLFSYMIYRGYWSPEYSMYAAPLLNVAEFVLFLAGLGMLLKKPRVRGNYYLIATLILGVILVAVRATASFALIIPLIYFVIAAGLHILTEEWKKVFPRNPFARILSLSFITLLVIFSVMYHVRAYFVAWPNAPETKAVYTVKQPS